jgi:iron complex outermembrane receptor protein
MKRLFLPVLILLLLPLPDFSEEKDVWRESHTIIVTATRSEKEVKDISLSVSVLTREEIEFAVANSATEILNILPGIFVQKTGQFGRSDLIIRGLGDNGRRILILVDGRPEKMSLYGCTITHSLPLDNVEKIEVIRGPLSVLYGTDSLGGVVNIITRKIEKGFESDILASYGSFDTKIFRIRHGGNFKNLDYYLTFDRRSSDGHLPNSSYNGKDFSARIGYKINENLNFYLTGKYFDGYKEEPLRATDPKNLVSNLWNDYERGSLDLNFEGKWEGSSLFLKLYRNFGEHVFSDGWHSKDFTDGAIIQGSKKISSSNELIFGTDYKNEGGESLNSPKGEWKRKEYAFFLQDQQVLSNRVILNFGARYHIDEISGDELSPHAGIVFRLGGRTNIKGSISKGFRTPKINELYMFPSSNKNLKPERAWNYEIGFDHNFGEFLRFEITAFLMKGENMIQLTKFLTPPPLFRFENTGKFEFKGAELSINSKISERLSLDFNYSYLDPGELTLGRAMDKLDLIIRYRLNRFTLSANSQYVGRYYADNNRKSRIDDYFITNLFAGFEIVKNLKLILKIENIFDRNYSLYVDIPGGKAGLYRMPGRSINFGFSWSI